MSKETSLSGFSNSERGSVLKGDEWILFQIATGPCAVGCTYCYERPVALRMVANSPKKDSISTTNLNNMDNAKLAAFIRKNQATLKTEMTLDQIKHYFSLIKKSKISRVGLIGSEPTQHPQFKEILDLALQQGIDLLVYMGSMGINPKSLDKINHPAVKWVVLHIDYKRLGNTPKLLEEFKKRELPTTKFMQKVNELIAIGKEFHLRVNFSDESLWEKESIFSFYDRVDSQEKVLLKYSVSTKVVGEDSPYFTPETLKKAAPNLLSFIKQFKDSYSKAPLYSERPLFPCSFEVKEWEFAAEYGGVVSRCDMEYTIYPSGLALCPPSRDLVPGRPIKTVQELQNRINELREVATHVASTPSFDVCEDCSLRKDLSCQGGCFGYKVGLYKKNSS